jgi:hypothetical protein
MDDPFTELAWLRLVVFGCAMGPMFCVQQLVDVNEMKWSKWGVIL